MGDGHMLLGCTNAKVAEDTPLWTQDQIDTAKREADEICDALGIPYPYNTPLIDTKVGE